MKVEPLTPTIGATVYDVNLADVVDDSSLFDEIHDLWMNHLVLFFRDQVFQPEVQLAIGERFGPLHVHPAAPYVGDNPALMKIHTDKDSHRNNGEVWHSDVSADEEPPMASILRLHEVPSQGGDTLWANMYAVYEDLSDTLKRELQELEALHFMSYEGFYGDHNPQRDSPEAVHPMVRTHPVTGRQALYVNSGFTKKIVGMTPKESSALLEMLFEQTRRPEFHCRFRWQQNSVAIWDNRCTQHLALWDYYPESRSGIRVTVRGDKPFYRPGVNNSISPRPSAKVGRVLSG